MFMVSLKNYTYIIKETNIYICVLVLLFVYVCVFMSVYFRVFGVHIWKVINKIVRCEAYIPSDH